MAPAILPLAGNFVGVSSNINGNVLKTHAHIGSDVLPVTTIINRVMRNTANPIYPTIIAAIVFAINYSLC